jgi:serine/threonine-protein kinase
LAVIARTTAAHYKSTKKDVAHIGRELGVDYVVEGGVQRSDGHVAMNVQLIQVSDQAHVFAEKYEAELSGLFGLQTRIAEDIARRIPSLPALRPGGPARRKPTEDLEAYQLYLQGRQHMLSMTPEGQAKARRCFEEALARDPRFALAYDGLGELYWWMGFFGYLPPKQASFEGLGAVLSAIEIDPSLGETHALLGQFRQKIEYNWPEVRREMMLALEMDPSSPLVRARYAVSYLMPHGRLEEALAQVERGLEIDPLSWVLNLWQAIFLWLARDYERGLRAARFFEGLDPGAWGPKFVIASVYREGGRIEEALAYQKRAVELSGGAPQMLGFLALTLTRLGKMTEARSLLERLREIAARTYVSPSSFAWAHIGLGEYDEAIQRLEQAIDDRDSMIIPIKTYAFLDPLRSDPRFAGLIRKMNLEP